MTIDVKGILRVGTAAQAAALAAHNLKGLKSKKPSKDLIKKGVTNIVGIEIIKKQSQLIGGL